MINSTWMKSFLEDGLNEVNDIENTKFRIVSDLGDYKESERTGNTVTNYINGILTTSPSTNETANGGLVVAIEQYTLRIVIPTVRIRTTPTEDPQSWEDGEAVYVQHVKDLIDEFFKANTNTEMTEQDIVYALGFTYSMSGTGTAAINTLIGNCIDFTVNIAVTVVQNGINSMDVIVTVDGKQVPYQKALPNRTAVQTSNVFSSDPAAKILETSTVFALDVETPALKTISSAGHWLLYGEVNEAHIVGMTYGEEKRYFLLQFVNSRGLSAGVANIGESYGLSECAYMPDMLDFPDVYTVTEQTFDTVPTEMTVSVPSGGTYICLFPDGTIDEMDGGTSRAVDIPDSGLFYDKANDKYVAYFVYCKLEADNA